MRNKKAEAIILLLCGLISIAAAYYIYFFAHKIYPGSGSAKVQDMNWLLKTFGKKGTAILIAMPGLILVYVAIWKLKRTG